jgi:hypothetical protein
MSKAKRLGKMYGGVWTYDGETRWNCDDGKRYVARHAGHIDDVGDAHGIRYAIYDTLTGIGMSVDFKPTLE